VKVDALNCIDCLLGGKGKFLAADPAHDLMFLSPGMTDFFKHAQKMMLKEGMDKEALAKLFSGLKGIVIFDTLGNIAELKSKVEDLSTGLPILEIKTIGCDNLNNVIQEAEERIDGRRSKKPEAE